MKKILLLFLAFSLAFSMISCFDNATENGSTTETTTAPVPNDSQIFVNYDEYVEIINSTEIPAYLFTNEDFSQLGTMAQFFHTSEYLKYGYLIHPNGDENLPLIHLYFIHDDYQGSRYLGDRESRPTIDDYTGNDLRSMPDQRSGLYESNGVLYLYENGVLGMIVWKGAAGEYYLGCNGEKPFETYFYEDSNPIKLFLNKETIPSAIAAFDEMLNTSQTPAT